MEAFWVCVSQYDMEPNEVAARLLEILKLEGITINSKQTLQSACQILIQNNQQSIVDCILIAHSLETDIRLESFDVKLQKLIRKLQK